MALATGTPAPTFNKRGDNGDRIDLGEFKGKKNVLLAFFPGAFTSGCASEMANLNQAIKQFEELDTQVIGMSLDSQFSLRAFSNSLGSLRFPLVTDFNPKGSVSKDYDIWNGESERGHNVRATFIIDKEGIIRFSETYEAGMLPDAKELVAEVAKVAKQ
ncbi:MAG: redoxin domain-containing protein [Chloroflexi bacterium]|nr:redoxin domain-containing protein [Chloroflexota bacterium]MCZ6789627.1 redoxin domain-containing protein [Chloroflexota bacterium]MCZ6892061.1 redoxin domain-containing protein [Chloroflexota bacterium]